MNGKHFFEDNVEMWVKARKGQEATIACKECEHTKVKLTEMKLDKASIRCNYSVSPFDLLPCEFTLTDIKFLVEGKSNFEVPLLRRTFVAKIKTTYTKGTTTFMQRVEARDAGSRSFLLKYPTGPQLFLHKSWVFYPALVDAVILRIFNSQTPWLMCQYYN